MSEQPTKLTTNEINPRTARTVAAILGQTSTDEAMRELNFSDGRNQSEQASFLAAQSPFLREIYERGGTVADGVLTVPRENLSVSPQIEIATTQTAVKRLTHITGDAEKAKELAPQLVAHGEQIAGKQSDGQTRLKVFGWLYRVLEGKQDLLATESPQILEREQTKQTETSFGEKWQQIVELSEALAALEPKDKLPENSFDEFRENEQKLGYKSEPDENITESEIYENAIDRDTDERAEEIISSVGLIGFERIEINSDLPKIPENIGRSDFEKLLEKTPNIDSQLENGFPVREILAPFRGYVELTRLDNELRQVEEEYVKVLFQKNDKEILETAENYRFVAKREEMRELADDKLLLDDLRARQNKIAETLQTNFSQNESNKTFEQSISNNGLLDKGEQTNNFKQQKIEFTEDELELQKFLVEEKNINREIETLSESMNEREINFRAQTESESVEITSQRQKDLTEKVLALELPVPNILKEKYPELTPNARNEKLSQANTFEIQNPAEYLFVREAATKHFLILKMREIKNEYRKLEGKNISEFADKNSARKEYAEHWGKIKDLKSLEPVFSYKIEGSNKIINSEPSERAVAGYEFVNQYISYQLKQPETQKRRESVIYRQYAERLESAKRTQDVLLESYKVRQENHSAAGIWKNATKEEREQINRPLSKNEMSLLFLEQAPRSFTAEMSFIKYNFAHYSSAKEKMTSALLEGKLEPSAEAEKLVQSLENRLVRRDLITKHKATKHFFESLKTPNHKLFIKNEFDHQAIYQKLPPHEKDWIYKRASSQRENLEYKIAYALAQSAERSIQPSSPIVNEATKNLRKDFAAGTLWHQATILTDHKPAKDTTRATNRNEKMLQAVGFLIHNQTEETNLRVGDWLERQDGEELKTAGEILKTFAVATRKIEDNRMTVKVKITESEKVSAADYQNLFERYFPADYEKLKEFRAFEGEKFRLEKSRRRGQTAVLNDWQTGFQSKNYRTDAPISVFENEIHATKEIEKIKAAQTECRRAMEIQSAVLLKTEEKLKKELSKSNHTISPEELRAAVKYAFTPQTGEKLSVEQKAIFEKAQNKISISDFERFTESAKKLENGLVSINQSFANITAIRLKNVQYEYNPKATEKNESLQKQYESLQKQLKSEIVSIGAREKFSANQVKIEDKTTTIFEFLPAEEWDKTIVESHRQTRIALEPSELTELKQSNEIQTEALKFADALETVHQVHLQHKSAFEIKQALTVAEEKRENLRTFLKAEKESSISLAQKPVTLKIYERELAKNEQAITKAKISEMIETGKISLADLEMKKVSEIFSPLEREDIRLEAGERTRENLEPKELWAKRRELSENLQQTALGASDTLERAHEIYHDQNASKGEISRVFFALDADIVKLKNERKLEQKATKFINFKTDFKRDLAQMFERNQPLENPNLLTAMTKGLLSNALEKQNIHSEKLGINSEKLSEISRTITLAMVDDKRKEKLVAAGKSTVVSVQDNFPAQTKTNSENPNTPLKTRQFEHTR